MWRQIILGVGLGACGFQSRAAEDSDAQGGRDAASGDAPSEGSGGSATDCFRHWFDGSLRFSLPQELTTLSSNSNERDPWISEDGLRMYFASNRAGTNDIYLASRASVMQSFDAPTLLANLRTTDHQEDRASLTADEKMLVLASDRGTGGKADIYLITRNATTDVFGTPLLDHLGNVNSGGVANYDPFLTADGLKLYFSPDPQGAARQQIAFTTRTDVNGDFAAPVGVPGINNAGGAVNADPAVSLDERIIVFSSDRAGGLGQLDLWYATRQSSTQPFSAPVRMPDVNSSTDDGDPMIGADGCDLYFASARGGGGRFHLLHAQLMR